MKLPILPGNRYRVTIVTRPDRQWPFQLKIYDRLTEQVSREVIRGLTIRQRGRAYERAAERERQLNTGAIGPLAAIPWAEARKAALATIEAETRETTVAGYQWAFDRFERYVESAEGLKKRPGPDCKKLRFVDQVTGPLVQGYVAWRRNGGDGKRVEGSTVNKDLRHLAAIWTYMIRKGLARENPWTNVPKLEAFKRKRVRLTFEQRELLLAKAGNISLKFHAAVSLASDTGPRVEELSHVTWPHIDIASRSWLITREPCGWQPKGNAERIVRFGDDTAHVLEEWRNAQVATVMSKTGVTAEEARIIVSAGRVFGRGRSRKHDPWERDFNNDLRDACKAAGIPTVLCHGLRFTVGYLAKVAGAAPLDIKDLLGHACFTTTQHYIGEDQESGAAAAFEALQRASRQRSIGAKQVPQQKDGAGESACGLSPANP